MGLISYDELYRKVAGRSEAERSVASASDPKVVVKRLEKIERRADETVITAIKERPSAREAASLLKR